MAILSQFLLRLAFGLAVGMAITPPSKVFSGFYRNHLYVTLGLTTLAALLLASIYMPAAACAGLAAGLSFLAAATWLYEAKRAGLVLIQLVAICSLLAALMAASIVKHDYSQPTAGGTEEIVIVAGTHLTALRAVSIATSGLALGITIACMFLGHWHLNAPGMELEPLRRLILAAAVAVVLQMIVAGAGFALEVSHRASLPFDWLLFVALRWLFGLLGVLGLLWMAWQTLKIPNTQSATGILYVAVIGVFVGELTGLLLSAQSAYPL